MTTTTAAIQITAGTKIPGRITAHGVGSIFQPDPDGADTLTVTQNVPAMVMGRRDRAIEGTVDGTRLLLGLITTHTHNDTPIPVR